jgi:hypothetical protein
MWCSPMVHWGPDDEGVGEEKRDAVKTGLEQRKTRT